MNIFYIPGYIRAWKFSREKSKGDKSKMTQREANMLSEGPTMDPADVISNFMNMIMTCCFFSPIIPASIPLAFLSSVFYYWTTKYILVRKVKMPEMFGELMATFFMNMMPYLVLGWACASYAFYYFLNNAILQEDFSSKRFTEVELQSGFVLQWSVVQGILEITLIVLVLVFVIVMLPLRALTQMCSLKSVLNNKENETLYRDIALTFQTDYDKANPLTRQKGIERLHQIHVQKLKAAGQQEELRKLQADYQQQLGDSKDISG